MEQNIEFTGKTIDEAIAAATKELGVDESQLEITVLEEGNKGIFGIIGAKQARVKVSVKKSVSDRAKDFLEGVLDRMGVEADIDLSEEDNNITLKLSGKNMGILIGRRGETLDSLQYLTSLAANKGEEKFRKIVIDTENYRQKREETLTALAKKLADRVIKYRRNITLEPMNPYERRVIHSVLQNNKYVNTYSVGEEPNRKVVITLK